MAAGFCTNCGYGLDTGSNFCAGCGYEVTRQGSELVQWPKSVAGVQLADRWERLGARMLDLLFVGVPLFISFIVIEFVGAIDVRDSYSTTATFLLRLLFISPIIAYFVYQAVLLTQRGQTLGKRAVGIRIVKRTTNQNGGFVTNVLIREIASSLLGIIIPLYHLFDVLWIFSPSKRTLHDRIADTVVIEA